MLRIIITLVIIALAFVTTGCSVFGVATRNDLDAALLQEQAERQRSEARLEAVDQRLRLVAEDLEALDRRLRPRLASLDSALIRTSAEVSMVSERWDRLRQDLAAHLDTLDARYDAVLVELDGLGADLGLASVSARDADRRSARAIQLHRDALAWERDRLNRRLLELETRLLELDTVPDTLSAGPEQPEPQPLVTITGS